MFSSDWMIELCSGHITVPAGRLRNGRRRFAARLPTRLGAIRIHARNKRHRDTSPGHERKSRNDPRIKISYTGTKESPFSKAVIDLQEAKFRRILAG